MNSTFRHNNTDIYTNLLPSLLRITQGLECTVSEKKEIRKILGILEESKLSYTTTHRLA